MFEASVPRVRIRAPALSLGRAGKSINENVKDIQNIKTAKNKHKTQKAPKRLKSSKSVPVVCVLVPFISVSCFYTVLKLCLSFSFLFTLFPARPKDKAGALTRTRRTDASNTKGS